MWSNVRVNMCVRDLISFHNVMSRWTPGNDPVVSEWNTWPVDLWGGVRLSHSPPGLISSSVIPSPGFRTRIRVSVVYYDWMSGCLYTLVFGLGWEGLWNICGMCLWCVEYVSMSVVVQDVIEVVIMVMVFGLGSILMGEGGFVKYMCVYVCGVSSIQVWMWGWNSYSTSTVSVLVMT